MNTKLQGRQHSKSQNLLLLSVNVKLPTYNNVLLLLHRLLWHNCLAQWLLQHNHCCHLQLDQFEEENDVNHLVFFDRDIQSGNEKILSVYSKVKEKTVSYTEDLIYASVEN